MDRALDDKAVTVTSDSVYSASKVDALGTIYFDYDKYELSSSAISEIRKFAESIRANSSEGVRVEGHCDERGTREYNLALGEKRAKAVSEILIINGISSNKITIVSYGEERPIVYGSNEEAWAKNRRAIVEIL